MKKTLICILTLVLAAACVKPDFEFDPDTVKTSAGGSVSNASPTSISVVYSQESGSATVQFNATADWTAEVINDRAQGWCRFNPGTGSKGAGLLTITVAANDSYDERSATIKVVCGEMTRTIQVTQKQKDALIVTAQKFELGAEGGNAEIEVKANVNVDWEIDAAAKSWVSLSQTKALSSKTLVFSVAANEEFQKREATISFSSGKLSEQVKIYQAAAKPTIVISKNDYAISDEGDEIKVEVSSNVNVSYEISKGCDWLYESRTKAMSTNSFVFCAEPNPSYEDRHATITFTNAENKLSEVVYVTQVQHDAIVVACDRYEMGSKGGLLTVELGHNVEYTVEISDRWISSVQTKSFDQETLTYEIAANGGEDSREGSITFSSKDGSIRQVVKIVQAQLDQIVIGEKQKTVSDKGGQVDIEIRSNVQYEYSIAQGSEWLHPVTTKGLVSKTLSFIADVNTSYDYREARIELTSLDGTLKEIVTVGQVQNDALVIAQDRYDVSSDGDEFFVRITHNVEFTYTINDEWIKEATTKALTESVIKFAVDKYKGEDSREGSIIFTSKDGKLSQTVKVCQSSMDQLVVGETSKTVSDKGGTFSIEVKANVDYSFKIEQTGDWLSNVATKGLVSKTLTFSAKANDEYDSREARIIITSSDGKLKQEVKVTQLQKDAIIAEKSSYSIDNDGGTISITVRSNVNFSTKITQGADWLSIPATKALSSSKVNVLVASNPDGKTRVGKIVFSLEESGLKEEITITQEDSGIDILTLTYSSKKVTIPSISGSNLTGTIDWGDGKTEDYSANASHSYSNSGSHTVTIQVKSAKTFSTAVSGVDLIDLSKF